MSPEPTPTTYAFLDLETTGLDPERHQIWEIGLVVEQLLNNEQGTAHCRKRLWEATYFLPVDLTTADPTALRIGNYYDRHPTPSGSGEYQSPHTLAPRLARWFNGAYLVGCTVNFDAAFMTKFLRDQGHQPCWDYHLIDATVYAAGRAGLRPPWKSQSVREYYAKHFGLDFDPGVAHRALDDARMSRDLFYAALDLGPA